jgi:choline dehydrogenase-like flavoprotein
MASATRVSALDAEGHAAAVVAALAGGVLGPDHAAEVPARVLATLDRLASRRDRDQLLGVLRLLDTHAGALSLTGRAVAVSSLPPERAEEVMQRWRSSRLPLQRRVFGALSAAILNAHYGWPGPAWERMGYPGPLGAAPDTPKRLDPVTVTGDEELVCDAVVVGSGAGGGTVAAELTRAGLDVVVLEKGGYRNEADFHHREGDAYADLYLYGLTLATTDLGCRILAGSTLGGGTVVNYTTSFKTPESVLAEWAKVSGIDAFVDGELDASLDAVCERLGVNLDSSAPGRRDQLMERGLEKLGWHCAPLPRDVRGCAQDASCGWCGFGCRLGAKQSTMRTYLEDAAGRGARILVGVDVRRVMINDARAVGVEGRVDGHRVRVRAKAVVVAGGAIETPALLLRSGLTGQVGRDLHLHAGTGAFGVFDDQVRFWEGTTQARYSAEPRERLGEYGPILETVPVHPGSGSGAIAWTSAAEHRALMDRFGYLSLCATLTRDTTRGRVRIDRDGNPRVAYRLNDADEHSLGTGLAMCGEVLAAAGATEVFSLHPERHTFRPDGAGAHQAWTESIRRSGFRSGRVTLFSFHQMSSCRMGVDPGRSVVGPDHETHQVKNLYVADASLFPTASGVNPMVSVMGLAHRAGGRIAARLG